MAHLSITVKTADGLLSCEGDEEAVAAFLEPLLGRGVLVEFEADGLDGVLWFARRYPVFPSR